MADSNTGGLQAGKLFAVDGLVVVITGGGSGLGASMARALSLNGASKVFIIGRREKSLQQVADSISDKSVIVPVAGDVTSKESLRSAYETISQQVSHVDVLIANSGTVGPTQTVYEPDSQKVLPIDQISKNILSPETKEITDTFEVNVVGVQYSIATFLPLLDAANKRRAEPPSVGNFKPRPQIITTSSIGAYGRRMISNISYGPSKAAVVHMTKQLATLFVDHDIRVNSIAPGFYLSEMTQDIYERSGTMQSHNIEGTFLKSYVPATRTGDDEDISGTILFLCSRAGAYINGNILVTDGGRLSVVPSAY